MVGHMCDENFMTSHIRSRISNKNFCTEFFVSIHQFWSRDREWGRVRRKGRILAFRVRRSFMSERKLCFFIWSKHCDCHCGRTICLASKKANNTIPVVSESIQLDKFHASVCVRVRECGCLIRNASEDRRPHAMSYAVQSRWAKHKIYDRQTTKCQIENRNMHTLYGFRHKIKRIIRWPTFHRARRTFNGENCQIYIAARWQSEFRINEKS